MTPSDRLQVNASAWQRGDHVAESANRRLLQWPDLRIEQLPTSDHMFRAIWVQRHVHGLLDAALERVLESEPG